MSIVQLLMDATPSGAATDSDAAAWQTAVIANSGTVSNATLSAVSDFCTSAKANGYWTKLVRINLFAGDQLAAALVPLKVGGGNATDTNFNFVGGDYTEATGLTGNGGNKHLVTGLIPSTALTINDTHLSVYVRSSTAAQGGVHIGAHVTNTQRLFHCHPNSSGSAQSDQYNATTGELVVASVATPFGHGLSSRTSSSSHVAYRNGSSIGSSATTGGSLPNNAIWVFDINFAGSGAVPVAHALGGYSIGSGMSSTDAANFYTDMQAFQTALSRNV